MKKVFIAAMLAVVTLSFSSCGAVGMMGTIYTDYTAPVAVTSLSLGKKVGSAKAISVLGLVAIGDGGINTAAKNGGIKKISHVDVKTTSILGIFTSHEYIVYGE